MPSVIIKPMHIRTLLFLLTFVLLSGCDIDPLKSSSDLLTGPEAQKALALQQNGEYLPAAQMWESMAKKSRSATDQAILVVYAAENWNRAGEYENALRLLKAIDRNNLFEPDRIRYGLALADAAIALKKPQVALDALYPLKTGKMNPAQHKQYLTSLATASNMAGDALAAVVALNELALLETSLDKRIETQQSIIDLLLDVNPTQRNAIAHSKDTVATGWLSLSDIWTQSIAAPDDASQKFNQWRQQNPGHPAESRLIVVMAQRIETMFNRPDNIAVIMADDGPYAKAANAVRSGLLAAYYADPSSEQMRIRFYDNSNEKNTWPNYQQAIQDGAELVIGPLSKNAVTELARSGELTIPVLGLNRIDPSENIPENFFQFALLPEAEARQAADKAWMDGHRTVALLVADTSQSKRIAQSFSERWVSLGGIILDTRSFDRGAVDYTEQIENLLNLSDSESRRDNIQKIIRNNVEFEPRRRTDVDFIFVSTPSKQAHQLLPQLKFFRASDLPVYSTSQAWGGISNPSRNIDISGLIFADAPWVLGIENQQPDPALTEFKDQLPALNIAYIRLYAMGMDAYWLASQLHRLYLDDNESYTGESGILTINELKQVDRRLAWAKINAAGEVVVIGFVEALPEEAVRSQPYELKPAIEHSGPEAPATPEAYERNPAQSDAAAN